MLSKMMAPPILLSFLLLATTMAAEAAPDWRRTPPRQSHIAVPTYVYAFGDSTTDTGNSPTADPVNNGEVYQPPFGMTWFHKGAGRRCDGRLIIDWLCLLAFDGRATAIAPPAELLLRAHLVPPDPLAWRRGGANYAVAGSTALDPAALWEAAAVNVTTPYSLGRQVEWFRADVANSSRWLVEGGRRRRSTSVVYLGETGGNDLNFAFAARRSMELIRCRLLPRVMAEVERQVERILEVDMSVHGWAPVTHVVVQGQFPMGCLAVYIQQLAASEKLDSLGCVASINAISDLQNHLILTSLIPAVAARHHNVSFVFLDSSAAFRHLLSRAQEYGFTHVGAEACYDHNVERRSCTDPSKYVSWDGIHLTDAFYGALTRLFVGGGGGFSIPPHNFLVSLAAHSRRRSHPQAKPS